MEGEPKQQHRMLGTGGELSNNNNDQFNISCEPSGMGPKKLNVPEGMLEAYI